MQQIYIPKQNYKVLVCTITYNQTKYITDTLDGVAMQHTNFPFVHYVIDDCSTDGEQEVIKSWLNEHCDMDKAEYIDLELASVILLPHKTNINLSYAIYLLKRNLWKEPKLKSTLVKPWRDHCEYEAICEGDDYWTHPEKLQKQVSFLDSHPEYALSHSAFDYYYQSEDRYIPCNMNKLLQLSDPSIEDIISRYHIQTHTVVLRSSMLKLAREDDPFLFSGYFMFGDTITWVQMRKFGKVHFLPENTGVYRKNEGSTTRNSVKALYAMDRSAAEFKWYVCQKFYLEKIRESLRLFLKDASRKYYFFDPGFKSEVYGNYKPTFCDLFLLKSGVGKFVYTYIVVLRKRCGPIYRSFKKKY